MIICLHVMLWECEVPICFPFYWWGEFLHLWKLSCLVSWMRNSPKGDLMALGATWVSFHFDWKSSWQAKIPILNPLTNYDENTKVCQHARRTDLSRQSLRIRHVKMSFIFGKRYFTFPVSQKGQISFPFPLWQKGQLYFSRYFSCTIFHKKSTGFGLKSVEVLVLKKVLIYGWMILRYFKTL